MSASRPPIVEVPEPPRQKALGALSRILTRPTAPFHEGEVRAQIVRELERIGVPWRLDPAGNLVARYRRGRARPVAFVAHMDHPGFEVLSVSGGIAEARWNGQVPTFDLRGVRMALRTGGRLRRATVLEGDGRGAPQRKELRLRVPPGTRPGDWGHADLVPVRLARGLVHSKALDNVAGCGAIVAALEHLVRLRLPGDVLALFTRAEEVGFHGTLAAIRDGTVPRSRPVVVLECSRQLPGAEQGKGPVIRVGDRASVFDPALVSACQEAAKGLVFQRRLMDGGVCEATAFGTQGYRSVCLAFPLGNYHNVGPKGIAPEFIVQDDFLNGVRCLAAFAARGLDPAGAWRRMGGWARGRFRPADYRRLAASRSLA